MHPVWRAAGPALGAAAALGAGVAAWSTLVEPRWFALRQFSVPVLPAGSAPLRVLHLSDLHLVPGQDHKVGWVRRLADLDPDLVVTTGDNLAHQEAVPAVLEAYEPIERRWHERVSALDIAVDEIPRIAPKDPENVQWPPEVIADGPVALARLIPAGVDVRGNATRARIMLFRKPIERRAKDTVELSELLHEVLVAQVATYLGVEPSVIDPTIEDE